MSKPFDATLKDLLELSPADWLLLTGTPRRRVSLIDADISTISGAADKVILVRDKPNWLLHVDFQAGPDTTLPRRAHLYNAVLEHRHDLLVRSLVVLLRPAAELANVNGVFESRFP